MSAIKWTDVAYRSNFINGELHVRQADGTMQLGEIDRIVLFRGSVYFYCEWMGESTDGGKTWQPTNYGGAYVSDETEIVREDGDLTFREGEVCYRLTTDKTLIHIIDPAALITMQPEGSA